MSRIFGYICIHSLEEFYPQQNGGVALVLATNRRMKQRREAVSVDTDGVIRHKEFAGI